MGKQTKSNGARKDSLHLPRPPRRRLGGDGGAGTRKRRLPPRQPRVRQPLGRGRRRQRRRGCRHWPSRRRWLPLDTGVFLALFWWQRVWRSGGGGLLESYSHTLFRTTTPYSPTPLVYHESESLTGMLHVH